MRGVMAQVIANAEPHALPLRCLHRPLGAWQIQSQRLFDQDVQATLGAGDDLIGVQAVGGRQDHGIAQISVEQRVQRRQATHGPWQVQRRPPLLQLTCITCTDRDKLDPAGCG